MCRRFFHTWQAVAADVEQVPMLALHRRCLGVPDCHSDHRRLRLLGGRLSLEAGGGKPILFTPQAPALAAGGEDTSHRKEDPNDCQPNDGVISGRPVRLEAEEIEDEFGGRDAEVGNNDKPT